MTPTSLMIRKIVANVVVVASIDLSLSLLNRNPLPSLLRSTLGLTHLNIEQLWTSLISLFWSALRLNWKMPPQLSIANREALRDSVKWLRKMDKKR